jgi:pentatricopeptide repeat protein
MEKPNVHPNVITATTLIDAFGRCKPSRIQQAEDLIVEFEENGYMPANNQRVSTALIRACSNSCDLEGVQRAYKNILLPDTISFNSVIEGYCRCGKVKMALETMADNNDRHHEGGEHIVPDVATYTILMSGILKIGTSSASNRALLLYNEMKRVWGIMPDRALVDVILAEMISGGNSLGVNDEDARFTMTVLSDAKKLSWRRGELYKREIAVKGVFMGRISEVWKEDEKKYGMKSNSENEEKKLDPLFQRKNWNKIDSGFRLWGGGNFEGKSTKSKSEVDEFLESKNWNDIDSSFRIL